MRAQRRSGGVAVLLGLLALLAAAPALAVSDADLQRRIEKRLTKAGFDQKADVAVDVESGVARLTGITLRWSDLREAERLARKEVKSVVNLLRVVPENPRTDKEIHADVERAVLRWERYGPFDAVGIEVADGVVKLSGWVDQPWKRGEIEARLARVDSVRDVLDNLRVQGFSQEDERLRREIYTKIYTDPLFDRWAGIPDPPIRIYVFRGRVVLAGTVGSTVEQVAVGHLARGTLAFSVSNEVQVEGEAAGKEEKKKDPGES
jgi:osmotically-inducible protein OsmY